MLSFEESWKNKCGMRFVGMHDEGDFQAQNWKASRYTADYPNSLVELELERQETSQETKILQLILEVILSIYPLKDSQLPRYGERQTPISIT